MRRIVIILVCLLTFSTSTHAEFRNQQALFDTAGVTLPEYIAHAIQFGFEWVLGDPYDPQKASEAVDAGLQVMYNSNNERAAKWIRFNNPTAGRDEQGWAEPNRVNFGNGNQPIPAFIYQEMKTSLCMTTHGRDNMDDDDLYDPVANQWKYRLYAPSNKNAIVFVPNLRSTHGVDAVVAGEMRNRNLHEQQFGGKRLYTGLFFDEVGFTGQAGETCANPINATGQLTWNEGRFKLTQDLRQAFVDLLGSDFGGMSGNPFAITNIIPEFDEEDYNFDLLYSESSGGSDCRPLNLLQGNHPNGCGTQDTTTWGEVSPTIVANQVADQTGKTTAQLYQKDYTGSALIYGRSAGQGVWGSWYGSNDLSATFHITPISLLHAIPNWDNLVDAEDRVWNETNDTYTSSNSFISPAMAWGRHKDYETNHKLFFTRHSGTGTFTLRNNEKVVTAKCVSDRLWVEQGTCTTGYFTQSSNVVTPGASIDNDDGYILFVHRQPSFASAVVPAANTVDLNLKTDDAPTAILPATDPTGYTVQVDNVTKVPDSITRTGPFTYRFAFPSGGAGTITTSDQEVTIAYTAGGGSPVTSGTNMLNGSKVPAANFGAQNVTNNLDGGGGGTPATSQSKHQWQNIVGSADDAPLYGTLNSQLNISPGGKARLIIKLRQETNAATPTSYPLYFKVDPVDPTDQTGAIPVTDSCATNLVCYTHARGIGSIVPTVEFLASDEITNVACGIIQNSSSIPFITLVQDSEAECIYALKFKETVTNGQRIYFYPREGDGSELDVYNDGNLPRAFVVNQRSDRQSGTSIGGIQ